MSYASQDVYYYLYMYIYIYIYISETAQRTCILHVLGLARIHKYIYALLRLCWGSNQALFRLYSGAVKTRLRRYYIYMIYSGFTQALLTRYYIHYFYICAYIYARSFIVFPCQTRNKETYILYAQIFFITAKVLCPQIHLRYPWLLRLYQDASKALLRLY